MPLQNTDASYGSIAKMFHWAIALLIAVIFPLGVLAVGAPAETQEELARKVMLFSLHKTLGVTIFLVALARILWAVIQPGPGLLNAHKPVEAWLAATVHWLLYGSLVLIPLSGWVHHAALSGYAPILWPFGQSMPFVPKSEWLASLAAGLHKVFQRVLILSLVLHVAGALKHHLIDRDDTLRRMLPGQTAAPGTGARRKILPLASALSVWAIALTIGGWLGVYVAHNTAPPEEQLDMVEADWLVESGTLALQILRFGKPVDGTFQDWTAAITFEPRNVPGIVGKVSVTVAIKSLQLGTVTDQAMGADFFDAERFSTAVFNAMIHRVADGYAADGTLRIKDVEVPVRLPFSLHIEGDRAEMAGRTTLDRRNFGIGDNMTDEAILAMSVDLEVSLVATRRP